MEEIEVKFLDIDVPKIEAKLREIGATKMFDRVYRRKVYDYPDMRLNALHAWVRVRDEGDKVTFGFKQRTGVTSSDGSSNDGGMDEVEVVVSDFDKTALLLEKIGLKRKFYEENRRIRWAKGDLEFDIDHWPLLNPYLEIEAKSWDQIDAALKLLELNPADKKVFSTHQIYKMAGIEEFDFDQLTFEHQLKKTEV
ncbi:MAG TPA: CYTH domain-containing protein [Candidatus Saccharimonadia bacterium]|jgi:adenylate cyclase class 2